MDEHPEQDIGSEVTIDDERSSPPPAKLHRGGRYGSEESPVWDHFIKNITIEGEKKNKCRHCSFSTKDKTPGNLQKHLKKHPTAFADVENKIEEKRPAASSAAVSKSSSTESISYIQTKITDHAGNKKKPYEKDSKEYKELICAVALLFASQSLPHILIESPEFKYFVELLNSQFKLPSRRQIPKSIENLFEMLKERIKDDLKNVQKLCIVLDGWTKKGLSQKYLGVLIKYFEPISMVKKSALIALQKIEGRSTAQNIKETLKTILSEWEIDENKILFYITDNGSDMVCALKECIVEFVPIIQNNETETESEDMAMFEEGDVNLDASFLEEEINRDLTEFDEFEDEHNLVFGYSKRIACIAHQLMCVVRKFVDKSKDLKPILKSALALVKKINKSTNHKSLLLKYNNNRGLLSPSETRWVYTYYVLKRLIESKEAVEKVIIEEELFDVALNGFQWKEIEQVRDLLAPFAAAVNLLEGDSYCTLSKVVPKLIDIISKMEQRSKKLDNFGILALHLQRELERRFEHILNFTNSHFQPAYMLSTFLDLNFVKGLTKEQQENCVRLLIMAVVQNDDDCQNVDQMVHSNPQELDDDMKEYSGFFDQAVQEPSTSISSSDRSKMFKIYLENYMQESSSFVSAGKLSANEKSISYWLSKKNIWPEISNYAINLLIVPASSAGIERAFSLAAIVQNRRYRLGAESTERELMIKMNRNYLVKNL